MADGGAKKPWPILIGVSGGGISFTVFADLGSRVLLVTKRFIGQVHKVMKIPIYHTQ